MSESKSPEIRNADVVGFLGSARRGGNSEVLLNRALAGAEAAGRTTSSIRLNDVRIRPCQNCGHCEKKGVCWIDDDMQAIYPILESAPCILLAAPIYFAGVSAQAKLMIDRCQPYWARKWVLDNPLEHTGRRAGFLSVGGFKRAGKFFDCAERLVKTWVITLNMDYAGMRAYEHVDAKGDAAKHPTAGGECFAFGKTL